jgi:hypothetical protein
VKASMSHADLIGWMAIAVLPMLLLVADVRHAIESRMLLHMMLQFPGLMAGGWAAYQVITRAGPVSVVRALDFIDWQGWTGAWLSLVVLTAWMIPSALDAALLSTPVAAIKVASWWCAGLMLAGSWRRWSPELLLFVVGNAVWMMATAGLLYIEAPLRLCASYLQDEQRHTGIALVGAALAIGVWGVRRAARFSGVTPGSAVSSAAPKSPRSPSTHAPHRPAGESDPPRASAAPHPES